MGASCGSSKYKQKVKENASPSKSSSKSKDRIIKCNIQCGTEFSNCNYSSNTDIKEIKQSLKRKIVKSNSENKIIKLYHEGKELLKDRAILGSIIEENEIDLLMVCITMTDEMLNDDKKMNELVIKKLTPNCTVHNQEITNIFCLACSHSICCICEKDSHKEHKVINKNDIMQFEETLKNYSSKLNDKFKEVGLELNPSSFYKTYRTDLVDQCEELLNAVENIKKKQSSLLNNFKANYDILMPNILDYKDKVELLISETEHGKEKLLSNDKDFFEFYYNYQKVIDNNKKTSSDLDQLHNTLGIHKNIFDDFKNRLSEILKCVNENFEKIKDFKTFDTRDQAQLLVKQENLGNSSKSCTGMDVNRLSFGLPNIPSPRVNVSQAKLNLFNLMNSPVKSRSVSKIFDKFKKRPAKHTNESNHKIDSEINSNRITMNFNSGKVEPMVPKCIANFEVSSKNIFLFETVTQNITKKELNYLPFKRFEAYHSSLNYRDKFYVSGGFSSTSKNFSQFSFDTEQFSKLSDMPSGHSFHAMLGLNDYIYVFAGFNSKKVEKYNIDTDNWVSLPSMSICRSWPSVMSLDDKYILVFGGLKYPEVLGLKTYEKFDCLKGTWEIVEVKFADDFPFYFGVLPKKQYFNNSDIENKDDSPFIMVGGKTKKNEENISGCFSFNLNENSLTSIQQLAIPMKDEFDGRMFLYLGNEESNFGQFSSIYPDRFYVYSCEKNSFKLIKWEQM